MPTARGAILSDGNEPASYTADGLQIQSTEQDKKSAAPAPATPPAAGAGGQARPLRTPPLRRPRPTRTPATPVLTGAPVDLWESGWPNGRFYWTVVPVRYVIEDTIPYAVATAAGVGATTVTVDSAGFQAGQAVIGAGAGSETVTILGVVGATLTLASPLTRAHAAGSPIIGSGSLRYYDVETPQDACAAGRVLEFGKTSEPAVSLRLPFVSGLSPKGRLTSAARAKPFYGSPLVAWEPALGADQYEVQWSKSKYPWRKEGGAMTYATSALLPVGPGSWWYRIRGINFSLPGTARAMTWSDLIELRVARPTFAVVKSGR